LTAATLRYLLLQAAATLAPRLPARTGYRVAALVADAVYAGARGTRRQMTRNLSVVVGAGAPPDRLRSLTRQAFRNLMWNYLELFRVAGRGLDELRAQARVEGLEHLHEAAERSRTGVIVVFGHVGTLEAFSQVTQLLPEYRFSVVVENMADDRMFRLYARLRRSQGLELVRTDEPYRILRMLRSGCHMIIAGDLDTTGTGTTVTFFGRPMRAPLGVGRLALRTGAPVLVATGWREDMSRPHRLRLRISPPLPLKGSSADTEDVQAAVQTVVSALQEQVAARPEQWLAFREVWVAQ
jgi:phosphatidylinositol dimannoside acyltransferase